MAANTSSREHPLQQPFIPSPIVEEVDEIPAPSAAEKSDTWQTTVAHVPSWPEGARTLKKHTWVSYFYGLGDLILVLLPVYFICKRSSYRILFKANSGIEVLATATAVLNGKPTKDNGFGRKVEFAMDLVSITFSVLVVLIDKWTDLLGSYNVSYCVCCDQRKKHEDDCTVSRGKRNQIKRAPCLQSSFWATTR